MKQLFYILLCLIFVFPKSALSLGTSSDAEELGLLAGLALACGSQKKLDDYELIASRLIANAAATEQEEKNQIRVYMQAKWNAMQRQKNDPALTCSEVLERFDQLPLFNSIVYRDGSVKLPDGKWSKPLRPNKY